MRLAARAATLVLILAGSAPLGAQEIRVTIHERHNYTYKCIGREFDGQIGAFLCFKFGSANIEFARVCVFHSDARRGTWRPPHGRP